MDSQQRRMLLGGIGQVLFGCLIGLIPPTAVAHYRSIVTAHIEFTANGVLLSVIAFLMPHLNLTKSTKRILEINAYFGTVFNGGAFLISAFTGYGTVLSHTVHKQFPFPHGIEGPMANLVTGCLFVCAITIIIALMLTFVGLYHMKTKNN